MTVVASFVFKDRCIFYFKFTTLNSFLFVFFTCIDYCIFLVIFFPRLHNKKIPKRFFFCNVCYCSHKREYTEARRTTFRQVECFWRQLGLGAYRCESTREGSGSSATTFTKEKDNIISAA